MNVKILTRTPTNAGGDFKGAGDLAIVGQHQKTTAPLVSDPGLTCPEAKHLCKYPILIYHDECMMEVIPRHWDTPETHSNQIVQVKGSF